MARITKVGLVQEHLENEGSITSLEAIKLYGATRLSAIIYILRNRGFEIENHWEECLDRYGNNTRFVRYTLTKQN